MLPLFAAPFLASRVASAQELATIRAIGPPNDGYKSVYYAQRSGIARRYGLNIEPTIASSGQAAAAALVGGSEDLAYTNMLAVIQAHIKGVPIQIVSPAALYMTEHPLSGMLVLSESPLKTARDLNGKTIGAPSLGDITTAATLAWIDKNGGDSKSVKMIEVPGSASVALLQEGRVAAVTVNEPAVGQALATGKVRVFCSPLDAIALRFQAAAFAVMQPAAAQNAEAMGRLVRAIHDAQVYTNAHLAETIDIVSAYSGATPDAVAHSVRIVDPEYVEPRNIQPVIDVLAKYGVIDKSFPASEIISPYALKPIA